MRPGLLAFLVALLIGCASAGPPGSAFAAGDMLVIENVAVVDVVGGEIRPGMTVIIRNGRIAAVGARLPVAVGARRLDGSRRFLIPGLWDMHAHHQAVGAASLPLFVANGVLGTRDMGSDADFIFPLRERIRSGETLGPSIVAAGPILDAAPSGWPFRRRVATAHEARAAVRDLARRGADFVKVHDQTPREAYFAIAAEARRLGLPFAGHVPARVQVEEAVVAGQASIEHLSNFNVYLQCSGGPTYRPDRCAALFRAMASAGVRQTPTLVFMRALPDLLAGGTIAHSDYVSPELERFGRENQEAAQLPPEALNFLRMQGEAALPAIRDMRAAGVRFMTGCDAMVPGFCLHDELEGLTRAGFSPLEALQAATIEPARFLGREASQGSVAPGRTADLLLLDANPLADIRNSRRIHAVVLGGRLIPSEQIRAMLAAARRR